MCFFVMNNLFYNEEGLTMNEKYDIKGSWVARNASLPKEGESATCTFCEQKFIFHRKKKQKVLKRLYSRSPSLQSERYELFSCFVLPYHLSCFVLFLFSPSLAL
jgi:hypothetical protein